MDTVTLSKQNRLFWLGRYASRSYIAIQYMLHQLDALIDGQPVPYEEFCRRLGIPCPYQDSKDFCRRYLFDPNDPCSVWNSIDSMLGNGMTLRETITSPTLAYLQMAQSALELASRSEAPAVELQWVLDDIMAFHGSFDDSVNTEAARNITKTGGMVEKLSLMLRLDLQPERVKQELLKLLNRLYKTDLSPQPEALAVVEQHAMETDHPVSKAELLAAVEGLFLL